METGKEYSDDHKLLVVCIIDIFYHCLEFNSDGWKPLPDLPLSKCY